MGLNGTVAVRDSSTTPSYSHVIHSRLAGCSQKVDVSFWKQLLRGRIFAREEWLWSGDGMPDRKSTPCGGIESSGGGTEAELGEDFGAGRW